MKHGHTATVHWQRSGREGFTDNRYSRVHRWLFDGGAEIRASASPHVVRAPLSDDTAVDPEEAFIAALASCHMLFFLSCAARDGFLVEEYRDDAIGMMEPDDRGRTVMTRVTLRPHVRYGEGKVPSEEVQDALHHQAHESCFLANSVHTRIAVETAPPATCARTGPVL